MPDARTYPRTGVDVGDPRDPVLRSASLATRACTCPSTAAAIRYLTRVISVGRAKACPVGLGRPFRLDCSVDKRRLRRMTSVSLPRLRLPGQAPSAWPGGLPGNQELLASLTVTDGAFAPAGVVATMA